MTINYPVQQPFEPVIAATYRVTYYEEGRLKKLYGRIRFPQSGGVHVFRDDGTDIFLPAVHKVEKLNPNGGLTES